MTDAQSLFDTLAAEYIGAPGVSLGRVWHNQGLTVQGKIFAMLVRGRLVVKIPARQAAALTESGQAVAFEPRPGRPMKEWVAVDPPADAADTERWRTLMADAIAYVSKEA